MKEEITKLIQKAEHALSVANGLLASGCYSDAVSKVYYAMFYSARALLLSENIDVSKHSAVEAALGRHFVKAGKMDVKYHRMFIEARNVREIADYDIDEVIESDTAHLKLSDGKVFFHAVKELLKIS